MKRYQRLAIDLVVDSYHFTVSLFESNLYIFSNASYIKDSLLIRAAHSHNKLITGLYRSLTGCCIHRKTRYLITFSAFV